MVSCYTYLYDILREMLERRELSLDIINIIGGRKSGKSYAAQEFSCESVGLVDKYGEKINVCVYGLRNTKDNSEELRNEFEQTLDRLGRGYARNKAKGLLELNNENYLQITGLYSQRNKGRKKTGLSRYENADYIVIIFEEAYEISEEDKQDMIEAVRGNSNTKIIIFNICNPWSVKSDMIARANQLSPFDKNKMIRDGEQFKIITYEKEGITIRELFHYTNWRVAAKDGVLSKSDIAGIMNSHNQKGKRYITADYGLPGFEGNAIYTELLNKLQNPLLNLTHDRIGGGVDVGLGSSAKSGITSAHFVGIKRGDSLDVFDEWTHDNKKVYMTPDNQAEQIVKFYARNFDEYYKRHKHLRPIPFDVRCDWSDKAFIQMMRSYAKRIGFDRWCNFINCDKQPIQDRVFVETYMLNQGTLRIDMNKCPNLMKELELCEWDDKKVAEPRRKDDNDHSLNSLEYAISPELYSFIREEDKSDMRPFLRKRI